MAKPKRTYICSHCGHSHPAWLGKCPGCNNWNTLEEHLTSGSSKPTPQQMVSPQPLNQIDLKQGGELRVRTGSSEFDNVLGGGLVAGSVVLIGGDPGVGKSTLLLTVLGEFSKRGVSTLYVSGEESNRQIAIRAKRLGMSDQPVQLLSTNEFSVVESSLKHTTPQVIVIDSVQTLRVAELESRSMMPLTQFNRITLLHQKAGGQRPPHIRWRHRGNDFSRNSIVILVEMPNTI